MAVEAVVYVVIQKVTDLLIQESIIFDKVIDQVEDIRLDLRRMRGFLTDAEERPKTDNAAKRWVEDFLETLYNVEDIVESYVLRIARKKKEMGFFQNYGFFFHDYTACRNLRKKMKQIEEKIEILKEKKPVHVEDAILKSLSLRQEKQLDNLEDIEASSISQTQRMLSSSYKEDGSDFVGFKDDVKQLEKRLNNERGKIIGVFGPLGSGKTTFVKRVYSRKSISEKFVCQAWLDVSENHVFEDFLLKVWNQVNGKRDKEFTVPDEKQLKEFLQEKKYLIVLDDAREQPDGWKKLIDTLPEVYGSKVVLITREEGIAKSQDSDGEPLEARQLSGDESWKLFIKKSCSGKVNKSWEKELSQIENRTLPNQILKICKGLPSNIVLLGGFLSAKKMSYEELIQLFFQANRGIMDPDIRLFSYTDLPAHYKLCLLYLTLFPKEFDISVRRIIRLWLAEGFLQCPPGMGLGEDFAEECFNDLVKRNLVKISKLKSDGGPRKCHLPGFLRECLSPIAQKTSLFHIHEMSAEQRHQSPLVRRIVEYADIKDYASDSNSHNLRSYLSFNFQRYDTPAKGVGNFLRKIIGNKGFVLLRVLDLEGVYKPILPTTLKHLFQLRYLGLRWTFLDSLPKSVGDLPYLETLDLKRTYINTLPSSVWKLKHLRHLNLPQVCLDMNMQQPSSRLLTLWGLVNDDYCIMKNGLDQLDDLRELGITCHLENFDELMCWITKLSHLQSLSLTSKNEMGCPSKLCLQSMSELCKLSHLKLLGELNPLLNKDQFPPHLRVLTLSVSNLKEDPMEILSQLQCLSVLRLLAKSYLGQKMHCPQNGFSNLQVLKLWMLDGLEEWTVQQGGMRIIKELNIRCCQNLKKIPRELLQRTTLEKVIATSMPEEFEKNVREYISEHTLLKLNSYEFTPLPWEKEPDLWQIDSSPQQIDSQSVHSII